MAAVLIRNGRSVTFESAVLSPVFRDLRNASSSVMSASAKFVTCGFTTELRVRLAPASFLILERGARSIGPNREKSIFGHASTFTPSKSSSSVRAGIAIAFLINVSKSPLTMRPRGPVPTTTDRSIPNSRAIRRIDGEPCEVRSDAQLSEALLVWEQCLYCINCALNIAHRR